MHSPDADVLASVLAVKRDARAAIAAGAREPKHDGRAHLEALEVEAFGEGAAGSGHAGAEGRRRLGGIDRCARPVARRRCPAGPCFGARAPAGIAVAVPDEPIDMRNGVSPEEAEAAGSRRRA